MRLRRFRFRWTIGLMMTLIATVGVGIGIVRHMVRAEQLRRENERLILVRTIAVEQANVDMMLRENAAAKAELKTIVPSKP